MSPSPTVEYFRGRERVLGNADLRERLEQVERTLLVVVDRLERCVERLEQDREEPHENG